MYNTKRGSTNGYLLLAMCFIVLGFLCTYLFFNNEPENPTHINSRLRSEPESETILEEYYQFNGTLGDFIGGIVGTFFSLSGTLLIFLTFREQSKQNKREGFESAFFEMIRLHRENVSEMKYQKSDGFKDNISENRKVFRVIFQEFIECYREIKKFSRSTNVDHYFKDSYKFKLQHIVDQINPEIDLSELALIDIAYSIVFFGVGIEGESILRTRFLHKYKSEYVYRLLLYIKMKPKKDNESYNNIWTDVSGMELSRLRPLIEELYKFKTNKIKVTDLSSKAVDVLFKDNYEKYYGGHQHRLGHYFRHLFQSYKYLNGYIYLSQQQKYFYGKTLRAQLSTYEQALIFINSISSLGMKWEYTPESKMSQFSDDELVNEDYSNKLITTYNLIKNLPGKHLYGIRYKDYYPYVEFEADENFE